MSGKKVKRIKTALPGHWFYKSKKKLDLTWMFIEKDTVCPRSLGPFHCISYGKLLYKMGQEFLWHVVCIAKSLVPTWHLAWMFWCEIVRGESRRKSQGMPQRSSQTCAKFYDRKTHFTSEKQVFDQEFVMHHIPQYLD